MVRIAIFSGKSQIGNMISMGLCSLLKEHILIGNHRCCAVGDKAQYLIFETTKLNDFVAMRPHIMIFDSDATQDIGLEINGENAFAIVESQNFEIAKNLSKGIKIVVCGISPKDTITVSSIDDNEIVISIQRAIIDINGNIIEPQEAKISTATINGMEYEALAAIAALLICGYRLDSLKNIW